MSRPRQWVPWAALAATLALYKAESVVPVPPAPEPQDLLYSLPTDQFLAGAFVGFLSRERSNPAAAETAFFLKSRSVHVSLGDPGSDRVLAQFDSGDERLTLNQSRIGALASTSLDALVKKSSQLVVHEARHGRYAEMLGTSWNSREQELACRSYEVLYLLWRLRRDPDYLRYEEFDGKMMDQLDPAPKVYGPVSFVRRADWWRTPLPGDVGLEAVRRAADRVPMPAEDKSLDPEMVYHWYLLHRLGQGTGLYWQELEAVVPKDYRSIDEAHPPEMSPAQVDSYRAFFRMERSRIDSLLTAAASPI